MKKKLSVIAFILVTCVAILGIIQYVYSFDYVLKLSGIVMDDILDIRVMDNCVLVLYKETFDNGDVGLGICSFTKKSNKWMKSGQRAESISARISVDVYFCPTDPVSFIAYGYINDPEVVSIKVINEGEEIGLAEIVKTRWKNIWVKDVKQGSIKIEGYNESGVRIYP